MVALPRARSPLGTEPASELTGKRNAESASASRARLNLKERGIFNSSPVEIGVEHTHLCDLVGRQLVELGRLPDCIRGGRVVDAERLFVVFSDIRVHPRDAELRVGSDHGYAG